MHPTTHDGRLVACVSLSFFAAIVLFLAGTSVPRGESAELSPMSASTPAPVSAPEPPAVAR